jgi:L-fucose isomerase-like protein
VALIAKFDVPLSACALGPPGERPSPEYLNLVRSVLGPDDTLEPAALDELTPDRPCDLAFLSPCGPSPAAPVLADRGTPAICLKTCRAYHPYHAAFYEELSARGGTRLPADLPEDVAASVRAVRARRAMRGMKLIVADPANDPHRIGRARDFAACVRDRLGVDILIRDTQEIRERAKTFSDEAADETLARWYENVLAGPGEMDPTHMRQVARLYLAERAILDETGAVGVTPHDIEGFLLAPGRPVMPNVTYGPLLFDGYLACEEADIEALVTELLLAAGLGAHPMMSNIYYAFRDRFDALESHEDYTPEAMEADARQCFEDGRVTVSHFGSPGVLPPGMMEEDRYRVRETLPDWPGQSMIWATPKLGPVLLARIDRNAAALHLVRGQADALGFGDRYGWHRGRWFIRLPDARDFARRALHHHYAIARDGGDTAALETLLFVLLALDRR